MEKAMTEIIKAYPSNALRITGMGDYKNVFIYHIDSIRQSYELAVHALLETEHYGGSFQVERRLNLLEWNHGMHQFIMISRQLSD